MFVFAHFSQIVIGSFVHENKVKNKIQNYIPVPRETVHRTILNLTSVRKKKSSLKYGLTGHRAHNNAMLPCARHYSKKPICSI